MWFAPDMLALAAQSRGKNSSPLDKRLRNTPCAEDAREEPNRIETRVDA
jgi:hypothetical protein